MIRVLLILFLLTGCSQQQVKSHIGTGAGAISGYYTCQGLLNAGIELTAACTLIGGMIGSNMFYSNDMNIHTAVFVDTLNTAPGKISNTTWGNSSNGNWGSIKINRTSPIINRLFFLLVETIFFSTTLSFLIWDFFLLLFFIS